MGLGKSIKKAVKKAAKVVTKAVTEPIKAVASVTHEISKPLGGDAYELTGELKKGVSKASDVVLSASNAGVDAIFNPVGAVKNVIKNPIEALTHYTGLEALYKGQGVANSAGTTSVETSAAKKNDEQTAQERSRMLSRQGMQGANPIMLLGQDFQPSELATDEELGGKGQ